MPVVYSDREGAPTKRVFLEGLRIFYHLEKIRYLISRVQLTQHPRPTTTTIGILIPFLLRRKRKPVLTEKFRKASLGRARPVKEKSHDYQKKADIICVPESPSGRPEIFTQGQSDNYKLS